VNHTTSYTGYNGSMSLIFRMNRNITSILDRIGIQVSFTEQYVPVDVFGEVRFSSVDFDSFYAIQLMNTTRWNVKNPVTGILIPTFNYTTTSTTVALPIINDTDPTNGYAAVSFGYQVLSVQNIAFAPNYQLTNLFGDFAGMFGVLCGIDTIKFMAGMRLIPKVVHRKNIFLMQDHFSG